MLSPRCRFMGGLIDLRTWKRRDHYLWFRKYAQPFFSVTVDVDVTAVWNASPQAGRAVLLSVVGVSHVEGGERCRGVPPAPSRRAACGATIASPSDRPSCGRTRHSASCASSRRRASSNLPRTDERRSRSRRAESAGAVQEDHRRHRLSFGAAVAALHVVHQRAAGQRRLDSAHRVRPGARARAGG